MAASSSRLPKMIRAWEYQRGSCQWRAPAPPPSLPPRECFGVSSSLACTHHETGCVQRSLSQAKILCFLPELETAAYRRRDMRWTTYELLASETE
ncbi:hypothetical protein ACRRTK_000331 [Alexandromys fortis]